MARKSGRSRRLSLFTRGNDRCPICLVPFSRTEVVNGSNVTLEHAPPKTLGGKVVCMTCKDCNAASGKMMDQAVASLAKAEAARKSGRGVEVELEIFGQKHTTYLSIDGPMSRAALDKASRDELTRKFIEYNPGREFVMIAPMVRGPVWDATKGIAIRKKEQPEQKYLAASHLRSAYLLVFSLLGSSGYTYAESGPLKKIRDQIKQPDLEIAPYLICDLSRYTTPRNAISINNSDRPYSWIVKLGPVGVILPHGGAFEKYDELVNSSDPISSFKPIWNTASFGRAPSFDFELPAQQPFRGKDLFGQELTFAIEQYEYRAVVVYQQDLLITVLATSNPIRLEKPVEVKGNELRLKWNKLVSQNSNDNGSGGGS